MQNSIIVTGAAGFIGSNFVIEWAREEDSSIIAFDLLTYAGNLRNISEVLQSPHHNFVRGDINDQKQLTDLFAKTKPCAIVHFAAESHVDRSILGPDEFIRTNINGTFHLLSAAREYWNSLSPENKEKFRFLHVSTDEVYGSLNPSDPAFSETTAYAPNSPYSASKAASDHLVRAFYHTYGLPVLTTNCSNNYGPYQFPEKLIPLMISHALKGKPLPIYGDGLNIRDWLYVGDHCRAIRMVLKEGKPGETYNIGGRNEIANIDVVRTICAVLDELKPKSSGSYSELITYVKDRPGHDRRYAIDATKIERELGWKPEETFATGIRKTVQWYLDNQQWVAEVESGAYREWIEANYAEREKTCGA